MMFLAIGLPQSQSLPLSQTLPRTSREDCVDAAGAKEVKEATLIALFIYAGKKLIDLGFEKAKKHLERCEAEKAKKNAEPGKA